MQVIGARVQFIEQADILDRNQSLVGKGRNQFDLPVAEWRDNSLGQDDDANRDPSRNKGTPSMVR